MPEDRTTRPKKTMTEKQKIARMANLASGRKKRIEAIKLKKETAKPDEFDLSSDDGSTESESDSDSDNGAFIISKKKKAPTRKRGKSEQRHGKADSQKVQSEVEELKNMIFELANVKLCVLFLSSLFPRAVHYT